MQTLTVATSVRPGRIAVLYDIADQDWIGSCQNILDLCASLWGGLASIIIPTDGTTISPLFWQLLETFDPDYICVYRATLRDLEQRDPNAFEQEVSAHIKQWDVGIVLDDNTLQEVRKKMRNLPLNNFTLSPELATEIKSRVAPFFHEENVVQAGSWQADQSPGYPHTPLIDLLPETDPPQKCIFPARSLPARDLLWYSAAIGSCTDELRNQFEAAGIQPVVVGDGTGNHDPLEQQRQLISFVVNRTSMERFVGLHLSRLDDPMPETVRTTVADLSFLNLGWFKQPRSTEWAPQALAVAGNTFSDFCLYLALNRMRERVFWIFPEITDLALSGAALRPDRTLSGTFNFSLRTATSYTQQYVPGLTLVSATLNEDQLFALRTTMGMAAQHGYDSAVEGNVFEIIPTSPLRFYDSGNAQRPRVLQLPDSQVLELFETPKPTGFRRINPSNHRWVTELELRGNAPPKHPDLGTWYLQGNNLGSLQIRTSASGIAYACPSAMFLSGQDIDTVLVRPNIRVPDPTEIFVKVAALAGLECRTSDKGFYAQESVQKLGGLRAACQFFQSPTGIQLTAAYLDIEKPKEKDEPKLGILLDGRRYLSAEDMVGMLKSEDAVIPYLDDFATKGIFHRGFIFQCQFCHDSAWFRMKDISDRFTCHRCFREQIFTSAHWKMPRIQPSLYYQLDEMVYQGLRHNMNVPLLALDRLQRGSNGSFLYVDELAFYPPQAKKPLIETDINCVVDGVLTIGEAKIVDRLDPIRKKETAIIKEYLSLAKQIGARQLVFATLAKQWDKGTLQRIHEVRGGQAVRLLFFTYDDLIG